jgi:pimeloyl-ACP methyl ester carboxylesterase
MATFVLVHGSTFGGWCWKWTAGDLRAAGHAIYAPSLTGLGDRAHLLGPGVTLTTHIRDIADLLFYEDLHDVVLIGHSYGGMVITGVAEEAADRLARLVYLDAFLPEDGESCFSIMPGIRERWADTTTTLDGVPVKLPFEADVLAQAWGITDPILRDWVVARSSPMPLTTHEEPICLPANRAARLARSYIYCTRNGIAQPAIKARELGLDYHELQTGHMAMLSAPHELASLLLGISERSAPVQHAAFSQAHHIACAGSISIRGHAGWIKSQDREQHRPSSIRTKEGGKSW